MNEEYSCMHKVNRKCVYKPNEVIFKALIYDTC